MPPRKAAILALTSAATLLAAGCEVKSFIDPSELVNASGKYKIRPDEQARVIAYRGGQGRALAVPILDELDFGIEDTGSYFSQSRPVLPQDLEASTEDYQIGPNDAVQIAIPELLGPGAVQQEVKRVSNSGEISLPLLQQPIRLEGLTEVQAEQAIQDAYRDADILRQPQVTLTVVESRNRIYSVYGFIQSPGKYPILERDFRLLDALINAGGVSLASGIETVYVFRNTSPDDTGTGGGNNAGNGNTPDAAPNRQGLEGFDPLDPGTDPLAPQGPQGRLDDLDQAMPAGTMVQATAAPGAAWDALLAQDTGENMDLIDEPDDADGIDGDGGPGFAAPDGPERSDESVDSTSDNAPVRLVPPGEEPRENAQGRVIEIDGREVPLDRGEAGAEPMETAPTMEPIELGEPQIDEDPATRPMVLEPLEALPDGQPSYDFPEPQEPEGVEVIRVPIKRLMRGEFKFNVAIRPGDKIFIEPPISTGLYYVGGHAARVGTYEFRGQPVTVSQAIIAAGMLDPVAIPQRTMLVRRIETAEGDDVNVHCRIDLAKIFAGTEPNIYLRPNDEIRVGTNFIAPFIAAARNAFRITYGFGFLYDRNYADNNDFGL